MGTNRQFPEHMLEPAGNSVISTYESRQAANHAVNVLAEADFDIKQLAILGQGLVGVEKVTMRLSYGKVALSGAFSGVYFGIGIALIALLVGIANPANLLNTFAAAFIVGIGLGMLMSVIGYATKRNRNSYLAINGLKAARYELVAPSSAVIPARRILAAHARAEHQG